MEACVLPGEGHQFSRAWYEENDQRWRIRIKEIAFGIPPPKPAVVERRALNRRVPKYYPRTKGIQRTKFETAQKKYRQCLLAAQFATGRTSEQLESTSRRGHVTTYRYVVWWVVVNVCDINMSMLACVIGWDRATIRYGIEKIGDALDDGDEEVRQLIADTRTKLAIVSSGKTHE